MSSYVERALSPAASDSALAFPSTLREDARNRPQKPGNITTPPRNLILGNQLIRTYP